MDKIEDPETVKLANELIVAMRCGDHKREQAIMQKLRNHVKQPVTHKA